MFQVALRVQNVLFLFFLFIIKSSMTLSLINSTISVTLIARVVVLRVCVCDPLVCSDSTCPQHSKCPIVTGPVTGF